MEIVENCLCCGANTFIEYQNAIDAYSKESFTLFQCRNCGFIFTNPRPSITEIAPYYNSSKYISHHSYDKGLVQSVYRRARNFMLKRKYKLIKNCLNKDSFSVLDYGCGTGDFLAYCANKNCSVVGIEPDEDARNVARDINGLDILNPLDELSFEPQSFDVITLWHVLEHLHFADETIIKLKSWLKPGGLLVIAVPNIESNDSFFYKQNWAALDVPRHLYHFSPNTIKKFLLKFEFNFLKQKPQWLDAYYVSLLSEQNKTQNKFLQIIKASTIGLGANITALFNKRYSSYIYSFTNC